MRAALQGKTVLVTGASRGIGRAIALKLAQQGAAVAVNYCHSAAAAEALVTQIVAQGGRAFACQADMARVEQIEGLFSRTLDEFGHLDMLVNNAGLAIFKPVAELSESDFDRTFDLNVKGVFFACQQAARQLADGGRIINITSTVTRVMLPEYAAYAASKAAIEQLTRVLAKELGTRGISVNAIAPGPTDTELFRAGKTEQQVAMLAGMAAFKRLGTPEDIANVVALLANADSGWITGQTICANGGFAA